MSKFGELIDLDIPVLLDFYTECQKLNLDIIGTMCLPPINQDTKIFFSD